MILLLDFGNTRVKAAVMDGGVMRHIYSGPVLSEPLSEAVEGLDINGGMWCSVHKPDDAIIDWMTGLGLSPLTPSTPVPITNSYDTPQSLGMDRLAAVVGAWAIRPGNDLLVIDAGTAITYDFISADGVYAGGNIAPGIGLRFASLHEHTSQLPLVSPDGDAPVSGRDTVSAIRGGVLKGIRYEVQGYMDELSARYPSLLVFLTGGDADFFDIRGKSTIFAVPDLVLYGLFRIVEYNDDKSVL